MTRHDDEGGRGGGRLPVGLAVQCSARPTGKAGGHSGTRPKFGHRLRLEKKDLDSKTPSWTGFCQVSTLHPVMDGNRATEKSRAVKNGK